MKPLMKLNSIVIALTTLTMFLIWSLLSSVIFTSIEVKLVVAFISYFTSIGFYRAIFKIMNIVVSKSLWVKKIIFGAYFFEGTWVGFFIGGDKLPKYFYEIHEQTLDGYVILGKVFNNDGTVHGVWKALDPAIDVKQSKLMYYYEADSYKNTFINPGLASFDCEREKNDSKPIKMIGFSSDLFRSGKLMALEVKESDKVSVNLKAP